MIAATSIRSSYYQGASERDPLRIAPLVEELGPDEAAAWDTYALGRPEVTLYHLHAWRPIAKRAYGIESPFLVARDEPHGTIRGVLPLFRISRPFSPYLTNGLFGSYGDVLADDLHYARALVTAATNGVEHGGADFLHLKLLGDASWPQLVRQDIWTTARLALGRNQEATWKNLTSAMRTKIRHAQNAGLVVNGDADLDGFYDVLSENMLRKGSPIYGRAFFDALCTELHSRAHVITLRKDGLVVAGAFLTWVNGVMYVPFASSRPAVFPLKANQLLWWEIIRYAHALNLDTLDFGSSMRNSSGLEFKKHWGPRIDPIGSHIYARAGVKPALAPADSRLARWTVAAWSHLGPMWAETLGPRVMRWIA